MVNERALLQLSNFTNIQLHNSSSFPHKRIKDPMNGEAHTLIKVHGWSISFGYGERKRTAAAFLQFAAGHADQRFAQAASTIVGGNAHLGDVSYVAAHPRTQDHAQRRTR